MCETASDGGGHAAVEFKRRKSRPGKIVTNGRIHAEHASMLRGSKKVVRQQEGSLRSLGDSNGSQW